MAGFDEDKNDNKVTSGTPSLKDDASHVSGTPSLKDDASHVFNFGPPPQTPSRRTLSGGRGSAPEGDDDDDFVVPDHIKDILNEVHGQGPDDSPVINTGEPEPQDKIVTFEEHEEDIYIIPPENPDSSAQEPVGEIKVESFSVTVEDKQENEPDVPTDPARDSIFTSLSGEDKQEEPDFSEFSSLPPVDAPDKPAGQSPSGRSLGGAKKSEDSIFDKPPHESDESGPKLKLPKKKTIRPLKKIMAVLLIAAVGGSGMFYGYGLYTKQMEESKKILGVTSQATIQDTVKKVAELVELSDPSEQPSEVANIEDTAKLSNNAFFDRAANGDVVLIYPVSKVAVLFRPSTAKVIAIGPVDSGTQVTPTPTIIPSEEELANPTSTLSPTKIPATKVGSDSAKTE